MIPWLAILELTAACQRIDGDEIVVRHLLRAAPVLAALPPDTVFGLSPRFGVRRTIPSFEIEAFARKHGLSPEAATTACIERRSERLAAAAVRAALTEAAMQVCHCQVEVTLSDFARYPVPPGPLVFPPGGASYPGPNGETHWRGYVDGPARLPVWAKARIETVREVLVAAGDLEAQILIAPHQVKAITKTLGIRAVVSGMTAAEITGLAPVRRIVAGTVLTRNLLNRPPEVRAGETVLIDSESGAIRLQIEARADSSGRRGDRIVVRNPVSGARFAAVVTGPQRAAAAGPVTPPGAKAAGEGRPEQQDSNSARGPSAAVTKVRAATVTTSGSPLREAQIR